MSGTSSPRAAAHILKPSGSTGLVEHDRKRRIVRLVPILAQGIKEQHCSEEALLRALRIVAFADGEYIYSQGQAERDLYIIEEGKVLITQRRATATVTDPNQPQTLMMLLPGRTRRRSVQDADMEIQLQTHYRFEYFGEMEAIQHKSRRFNAVASGGVNCLVLSEADYVGLLAPLHSLLLDRHLLRAHCVLEKHRLFKDFTPAQRQYLIDRCTHQTFQDGEVICQIGEHDDRYFILAAGEAHVVLDELPPPLVVPSRSRSNSMEAMSIIPDQETQVLTPQPVVVARKTPFQGFGEMGLLEKSRTARVVAVAETTTDGLVRCLVLTRRDYIAASQLHGATIDVEAEALLSTTLREEWSLVVNARNLHLSNPQVAHYLVLFIRKFKSAYNQKFVGRTMYLDFLRRLHNEPVIGEDFEFLMNRITWDSPTSSLSIIRSEIRRVLSLPPPQRNAAEISCIARLVEPTAFIDKFDRPPNVDKSKLARHLARFLEFVQIAKDAYLFRQGKIESRAFVILRGSINIVNEDVSAVNGVKHYEVIATLPAGASFGELSLVTRLPRSATAMAAVETDLMMLGREQLQQIASTIPGVSVQQMMVERAEFLSRLSFLKGSDFSQCIRVAHDLQECVYEPRHLFLQESTHLRTLYIVKSGEIAVYLKRTLSGATSPNIAMLTTGSSKTVLVRVATIGAQEFFGVAIASVTIVSPTASAATPTTSPASPSLPSVATTPTSTASGGSNGPSSTPSNVPTSLPLGATLDLGATVYMCMTQVVVLELSERGWRRLSPSSLHIIRNVLVERHAWHQHMTENQSEVSYYHPEKPWLPVLRTPAASCATGNSGATSATPVTTAVLRPSSQLARHLRDKHNHTSEYAKLFSPNAASASPASSPRSPRAAVTPLASSRSSVSNKSACWGWQQSPSATSVGAALGGSFAGGGAGSVCADRLLAPHRPLEPDMTSRRGSMQGNAWSVAISPLGSSRLPTTAHQEDARVASSPGRYHHQPQSPPKQDHEAAMTAMWRSTGVRR